MAIYNYKRVEDTWWFVERRERRGRIKFSKPPASSNVTRLASAAGR